MVDELSCCGTLFWVYLVVCFVLVIFAGMMSGLTLGLMSLGIMDLEVLIKSGSPQDKEHAEKILPVVKNQHLLLCTLLVGNALAMEALPIFLDSLVSAWVAILISVTLILMFGEIIPQAICSQHGLAIGAAMAPAVRVLVIAFFPVTYPISKLLDFILGPGETALFRRAELKTLVAFHGNEAGKGGELTHDETTIIAGALEMTEKSAVQAMTPINSVFSLDVNAKLDLETMNLVMAIGHSRIPVYSEKPNHIIGLVLVKNLLGIRPQDETPVKNCTIRKIPRVGEEMPLYDILNEFQKGHSHMAVVVKYNVEKSKFLKHDREQKVDRWKAATMKKQSLREDQKSRTYKYLALDIPGKADTESGSHESKGGEAAAAAATLISSIQGTDELQQRSKRSERGWEHSPDNVLDIKESVDFPSFSSDEEVTGVITMEDVIEELLQVEMKLGDISVENVTWHFHASPRPRNICTHVFEQCALLKSSSTQESHFLVKGVEVKRIPQKSEEILDETDEYIDVHARIKVNLLPPEGKDVPLHFPPKSVSRSSTLPKSFEPYLDDFVPDFVR